MGTGRRTPPVSARGRSQRAVASIEAAVTVVVQPGPLEQVLGFDRLPAGQEAGIERLLVLQRAEEGVGEVEALPARRPESLPIAGGRGDDHAVAARDGGGAGCRFVDEGAGVAGVDNHVDVVGAGGGLQIGEPQVEVRRSDLAGGRVPSALKRSTRP